MCGLPSGGAYGNSDLMARTPPCVSLKTLAAPLFIATACAENLERKIIVMHQYWCA